MKQEKNNTVIILSPALCKMARAATGLGVRDLAKLAHVSQSTVSRFERGEELKEVTISMLQRSLEAEGVQFVAENGGGPGVRLRKGKSGWE